MNDLNKLAEALESSARCVANGLQDPYAAPCMREAAALLRAAAGADVQGLMRMIDEHGLANYREGLDDKSGKGADATDVTIKRSEIESALRLAMAKGQP